MGIKINDIHSSTIKGLGTRNDSISILPSLERNVTNYKGVVSIRSVKVTTKKLTVRLYTESQPTDYYNKLSEVANWLFHLDKVKVQLDNDDFYYSGYLDSVDDFTHDFMKNGEGKANFILDGYKYLDETVNLVANVAAVVAYDGDEIAYPIITANAISGFTFTLGGKSFTYNGGNGLLVINFEDLTATLNGVPVTDITGEIVSLTSGNNNVTSNQNCSFTYKKKVI